MRIPVLNIQDMLDMKESWGQAQFVVATTPASTATTSSVTSPAVVNSTVANTTVVEFSSSPSIGELFRKLDEVLKSHFCLSICRSSG